MKMTFLWMITILGLITLFALLKAPFLGGTFLVFAFASSLILQNSKKENQQKKHWVYYKLALALTFFISIGSALFSYFKNIPCLHCKMEILSANIYFPLYKTQGGIVLFFKEAYVFAPKVCVFFIIMMVSIVVQLTSFYFTKRKKKEGQHA